MGIHGGQFGTGNRPEHREQPAENPQADQEPWRLDPLGHDRQAEEDPRADHGADHDAGRVKQAEVLLQLMGVGQRLPPKVLFTAANVTLRSTETRHRERAAPQR